MPAWMTVFAYWRESTPKRREGLIDLQLPREYNHQGIWKLVAFAKGTRNVNDFRPKNLNLFTIHFPLPAIVSILHRVSGAFLFLLIPFILWAFAYSLTPNGFDTLQQWLGNFWAKLIFWVLFVPFCFHLVAGIRHLLSDIHIGDTLKAGRMTAVLTFIISIVLIVLAGIWLWWNQY